MQLHEQLRTRINAGRRVPLTSTTRDGPYVIRICVLQLRTHLDRMEWKSVLRRSEARS